MLVRPESCGHGVEVLCGSEEGVQRGVHAVLAEDVNVVLGALVELLGGGVSRDINAEVRGCRREAAGGGGLAEGGAVVVGCGSCARERQ
eukprot:396675-Pyramimonas_sp.AAC.1